MRALGEETGISKSTVQRWFNLFSIQPHRQRHFKLSNDPFFVEKVRDIVGLYLNPPDHAVVLCVDEKTQVQALNRTQPMLPMGLGYVEGVTHDYVRHGTTTLFAALDLATGQVIAQCKKRHRHQEFLAFLNHIDTNVPEPFNVHIIADNYATHKHPKVRAWLAKRPRYHIHFTPTYASWLNQVEHAGSASSPKWPSAAAPSPPSPNSSAKSNSSSKTTTTAPSPSCGPPPLIPSLPRSNVFAHIYLRDTTLAGRGKTPVFERL